jgi:hypothetical protein
VKYCESSLSQSEQYYRVMNILCDSQLTKLAKRLKKEKVTIDIVNFGETEENAEKLKKFIETLNGKDRTSHLVTAHPGPLLSDILLSSPIFTDEEGAPLVPLGQGFEFGIDPTEDPELAMALRVSMEEQRQRQEEEVRRATQQSNEQGPPPTITEDTGVVVSQAGGGILAQAQTAELPYNPAFAGMPTSELTEEQELALALQMSLQGAGMSGLLEQAMETETTPTVATDGGEPTETTEVPEDSDSKYRLSYHIPLKCRQENCTVDVSESSTIMFSSCRFSTLAKEFFSLENEAPHIRTKEGEELKTNAHWLQVKMFCGVCISLLMFQSAH